MAQTRDPHLSLKTTLESTPVHTPGNIKKACQQIEYVLGQSKDNLRGFFEKAFLVLLKNLFGSEDEKGGWLNIASQPGRTDDAKALLKLLSPDGELFKAMAVADAEELITFTVFTERLPPYTQNLFSEPEGRELLHRWPHYKATILGAGQTPQLQLKVVDMYLFWFAYYAVRSQLSTRRLAPAPTAPGSHLLDRSKVIYSNLQHTASNMLGYLTSSAQQQQPYYQALGALLRALLPRSPDEGRANPTKIQDSDRPKAGQKALCILLEFILTDRYEPTPGMLARSAPASAPGTPMAGTPMAGMTPFNASTIPSTPALPPVLSVTTYVPPCEEQVEAARQLMRHIHIREPTGAEREPRPAQTQPWLQDVAIVTLPPPPPRLSAPPQRLLQGGCSAAQPVQLVMRKTYRMLRRAFAQWSHSSSSSLTPFVQLWITIIAPWATVRPVSRRASQTSSPGEPPGPSEGSHHWNLTPGAMAGQVLHAKPTTTAVVGRYTDQWAAHVQAHLPFYHVLIPQFLDLTYNRLKYNAELAISDMLRLFKALQGNTELADLLRKIEAEVNLTARARAQRGTGSFTDCVPWWLEQVNDWEQAAFSGVPTYPLAQADPSFRLFTSDDRSAAWYACAALQVAEEKVRPELVQQAREAARSFLPLHLIQIEPPAPQPVVDTRMYPTPGHWSSVKVKTDPMDEPIKSNEIGLLAKLLVRLSRLLNRCTGLDRPYDPSKHEVPENVVEEVFLFLRSKKCRVNLRPLAEVQTLGWLALLFFMLWMSLRYWLSPAAPAQPAVPPPAFKPVSTHTQQPHFATKYESAWEH